MKAPSVYIRLGNRPSELSDDLLDLTRTSLMGSWNTIGYQEVNSSSRKRLDKLFKKQQLGISRLFSSVHLEPNLETFAVSNLKTTVSAKSLQFERGSAWYSAPSCLQYQLLEAEAFLLLLTFLLILLLALQRFWMEQISFAKSLTPQKERRRYCSETTMPEKHCSEAWDWGHSVQDEGLLQWDCIASFSFSTAIFSSAAGERHHNLRKKALLIKMLFLLSHSASLQLRDISTFFFFPYIPFPQLLKNKYFSVVLLFLIFQIWGCMMKQSQKKINWGQEFPSEVIHELPLKHQTSATVDGWDMLVGWTIIILGDVVYEEQRLST